MNPAWCNARRHVARGCCSKAKCYRHGPNMRFQWMGFAKQTETWKPLKTVQNLCRKKSARFQWFPKNPLDFPKSISNDTLDTFFVSNEGPGLCTYVPMYLCIYVSMYLCIYVSMYLCIYVSMYLSMYVSMYLCIYVSMHLCIYDHLCIYVWTQVPPYVRTYVCVYIHALNELYNLFSSQAWKSEKALRGTLPQYSWKDHWE